MVRAVCRWYAHLFIGRRWYVKILSGVVSFIIFSLVYFGMVDINFLGLFGRSPGFYEISNPPSNSASEVFSKDGKTIGKFYNENRSPVKYEDVAPVFWDALVDTEDERFYHHRGIDFQGVLGAIKDAIVRSDPRGASTITQQLAKNMFRMRTQTSDGLLSDIPGLRMLIVKSKEWILATKIEMVYDKQEILTMYANTVDFGSNCYGIKTACKTYFDTTPADLTAEQAAVLVAMLKATTYYNPRLHPDNSLSRRNVVLNNMLTHGHLTQEAYDSLKALPLTLDYNVENAYDGDADYFREAVKIHLKEWCDDNGYDIYTDGLQIYTTIDTRMQRYAEEAVWEQMQKIQKKFNDHWGRTNPWQDERHREIPDFIENIAKRLPCYKRLERQFPDQPDSIDYYLNLPHPVRLFSYDGPVETEMSTLDSIRYMEHFMHCGFVAIEPATGHVKAWVGDLDFNTWQYDKVTAKRQPGSTFKLFVYTEAMNQGLTPCDRRVDSYFSMKTYDPVLKQETVWAPTNANGYFTGANMTLKSAFAQSINSIAVKLGQELGIDRIASTARKMGIESTLDETPSLALGASDVSLLELVNAYSTVANDGRVHKPILITRILDRDGKEVYTAPTEQQQAISYRSAFFMQQMLMGGLREPGGTSMNLWTFIHQFPDTDFGGKTGTSNNHSDAWFVGVSPQLVCGAWVGGEYRAIHFRTGQLGQGSRTALPVCGQFFQSVLGDPLFAHYRGKFPPLRDNTILSSMYQGTGYYYLPTDTIDEDDDEKLLYDELPDADAAPQQDAPADIPEGEPQQTAI